MSSAKTIRGIDTYIREQRCASGASQEQLAAALSVFSLEFSDIDALTISRWELGKVEPSLNRLVELIRFFGDQPHQVLGDETFAIRNLPSNASFEKQLRSKSIGKHLMGMHPYLPYRVDKFEDFDADSEFAQQSLFHLYAFLDNVNQGSLEWTYEQLTSLQQHGSVKVRYFAYRGLLAGHCFLLELKLPIYKQLINSNISEAQIDVSSLASSGEASGLYVLSIYTGRLECLDQVKSLLISYLSQQTQIESVGIRVYRDVANSWLNFLPHRIVSCGPLSPENMQGIKYQGKRYMYLYLEFEREKLLNSPLILNLLRAQEST